MKIVSLLLLVIASLTLQAQKVKVTWGEEGKRELYYGSLVQGSSNEMIKLCFEAKGGFLSKKSLTPVLSRYDTRLVEKGAKSFGMDEDNTTFNNLLSVKGNLYLFTNRYDETDKTTDFFAQKIDAGTLIPVGLPVSLGRMAAPDRNTQSTGHYELSKDSSKILFFGLSPYAKKGNERYYMAVYDSGLARLWDNTVELPYQSKLVDILDCVVANNGATGIIIRHYDKEMKKETIKEDGYPAPAYKTKFLLYRKGVTQPKEYVLDIQDKFLHNLQVTTDKSDNLTLFGLYKNKYDGYVSGYFITTLKQDENKMDLKKLETFPQELIALIKKDGQGSDKDKDPGLSTFFSLREAVEREDGTTDYLLEFYRRNIITTHNSNNSGRTLPVHNYGDVVDIVVNGTAPTQFVRLPKWQQTTATYLYSGFKTLTVKNKLMIFYNDDRDNVERELEKRPEEMTNFKKSVLVMAVIDGAGSLSRSVVFDHRDRNLTTCINVSQKLAGDKIGLYAQRYGSLFSGTKDRVGILEVD